MERHQIKLLRDSTFVHPDSVSSSSKSAGVGTRKATSGYASTAAKRGVKTEAAPSSSSTSALTRKPASLSEAVEDGAAATASSSRGAWGDAGFETGNDVEGAGKDVEYLEQKISGLMDENQALQKTLEATLAAKKQDLSLLQDMMTQTKGIFLKAMKELKGS